MQLNAVMKGSEEYKSVLLISTFRIFWVIKNFTDIMTVKKEVQELAI